MTSFESSLLGHHQDPQFGSREQHHSLQFDNTLPHIPDCVERKEDAMHGSTNPYFQGYGTYEPFITQQVPSTVNSGISDGSRESIVEFPLLLRDVQSYSPDTAPHHTVASSDCWNATDFGFPATSATNDAPIPAHHATDHFPVAIHSTPPADIQIALERYFVVRNGAQIHGDESQARYVRQMRTDILRCRKAASYSPCHWGEGCAFALDDISPNGIARHLTQFHAHDRTRDSRETCKWGACRNHDLMQYSSLGKHISCVHLKFDLWFCPFCSKEFSRWDALQRHVDASCSHVPWLSGAEHDGTPATTRS
ncbi:hypothetical protein OBBRIDRAFT_327679 [Obba rivulosa]|uniref:C2H2-type domain-containing protein n=1 Tax=Obba rivulosa TaxID=1052685 RepID=A0A8E2DPH0_9APHY|nr:hypothetical protein OBBRIDRAFT_327679 [Obba rivulosa]